MGEHLKEESQKKNLTFLLASHSVWHPLPRPPSFCRSPDTEQHRSGPPPPAGQRIRLDSARCPATLRRSLLSRVTDASLPSQVRVSQFTHSLWDCCWLLNNFCFLAWITYSHTYIGQIEWCALAWATFFFFLFFFFFFFWFFLGLELLIVM